MCRLVSGLVCQKQVSRAGISNYSIQKYAHGFVVLCFVVVMQSFIMHSHEVFIHIHQGCFAGTGAIVRLPQCQWSKPGGYGKISQCITTTKHSKAKTVCIFLGIYCAPHILLDVITCSCSWPWFLFQWNWGDERRSKVRYSVGSGPVSARVSDKLPIKHRSIPNLPARSSITVTDGYYDYTLPPLRTSGYHNRVG